VIEAIADPKIKGITCQMTYFSRGTINRLRQGNWFEDPSNSSIVCRQTGPVVIDTIETDEGGQEIQTQRTTPDLRIALASGPEGAPRLLPLRRMHKAPDRSSLWSSPAARSA
jgi:CreA protein